MAHPLLVESLRPVSTLPITEDELKKRVAGVDASAAKANCGQILNWTRCYLGLPLRTDVDAAIRAPFIKADKVFPQIAANELLRVLSGEILMEVLGRNDDLATLVSILLDCNPESGGAEPVAHLRPAAQAYLHKRAADVRRVAIPQTSTFAKLKLGGTVSASSELSELAAFATGLPGLVEAINREFAASRALQAQILKNQEILSEETQSLWWFLSQGTESGSMVDAKANHPQGYLFLLGVGLSKCVALMPPPASMNALVTRYIRALGDDPALAVDLATIYSDVPPSFQSALSDFSKSGLGELAGLLNGLTATTSPAASTLSRNRLCLQITKELLLSRLVVELNEEQ